MSRHAEGLLQPCGTPAAYRRHYRHGEKPCWTCVNAELERKGNGPASAGTDDRRERPSNGLPVATYRYQARRYLWAERVLAAAEARFGTPAGGAS